MSLSPSQDHQPDTTPPSGSPDVQAPQSGTRRRLSTPSIVYGGLGVLAVLIVVLVAVGVIDKEGRSPAAAPAAPTTTVNTDPCARTACGTVPNLVGLTAPRARQVLTQAGFTVPSDLARLGEESTVTRQYPSALLKVPTSTLLSLTYYAPPAPARAITARDWALIAKSPDAHVGERIVAYGQVTQFDAATGTSAFRANVDGVVHKPSYGYVDYETNTFLNESGTLFAQLVKGDLFRAEVTVTGSYSYSTTMGGTMTVPQLQVTAINVTGTAK
ncbi:hypothetical protein GCM10010472_50660 [Pseudonocardia halophobica]|uniref:PASTA domain-containing protein n=1 Tax=Pseudonocardia halophobica TaxID=29401 RepID=A0A9W6UGE7_9PSEU|nr:PASTA domain-containing protein [Pseudonocardia halophobica]GLL16118.1 hypothetical protein GCM10017577_72730 [Pseudonocardia halophobica]